MNTNRTRESGVLRLAATVVLALVLTAALPVAGGDRQEGEFWKPPIPRGKGPVVGFMSGRLDQDHLGTWSVNGVALSFREGAEIADPRSGSAVVPHEGMEVILMGQRFGSSMIVHRGMMVRDTTGLFTPQARGQIEWSQSDPSVGWGTGPQ